MKKKSASQIARKNHTKIILITIGALALFASPGNRAAELCNCDTHWIAGTDSWFTSSNWSDGPPNCGGSLCPPYGGARQGEIDNGGTAQISLPSQTAAACALTLGVTSSHSGTVTVDDSTLSVCGPIYVGSNGKGTLSVTNGGVVNTDVVAAIAEFTGSSGAVTVDGANSQWTITGPLYLAGSNTSAGGTGFLTVTNGGTVSPTSVYVYKSGTLTGNGRVSTTNGTTIAGTLEPSAGQLTIAGNLTFNGIGASMMANVVPASADNVNVTGGAASLNGRLSVTMTGTFTAGTTYTLLHADNGIVPNTSFSSVSIKFPTGQNFSPEITYDANNVYLYLASNTGP